MAKVKITLKRSLIGRPEDQRATAKALGLGKTNSLDNSLKLCGWRQCHQHEIARLEYDVPDMEVITKRGIESYDPYLYVRGRDFKKYFLA